MVDFYMFKINDWHGGCEDMNHEQEHAYRTICDSIYSADGVLRDDDRLLSFRCKMSLRKYRSIKKYLLDEGKIHIHDGIIGNDKCTVELSKIMDISDKAKIKATKSHEKRRENAAK